MGTVGVGRLSASLHQLMNCLSVSGSESDYVMRSMIGPLSPSGPRPGSGQPVGAGHPIADTGKPRAVINCGAGGSEGAEAHGRPASASRAFHGALGSGLSGQLAAVRWRTRRNAACWPFWSVAISAPVPYGMGESSTSRATFVRMRAGERQRHLGAVADAQDDQPRTSQLLRDVRVRPRGRCRRPNRRAPARVSATGGGGQRDGAVIHRVVARLELGLVLHLLPVEQVAAVHGAGAAHAAAVDGDDGPGLQHISTGQGQPLWQLQPGRMSGAGGDHQRTGVGRGGGRPGADDTDRHCSAGAADRVEVGVVGCAVRDPGGAGNPASPNTRGTGSGQLLGAAISGGPRVARWSGWARPARVPGVGCVARVRAQQRHATREQAVARDQSRHERDGPFHADHSSEPGRLLTHLRNGSARTDSRSRRPGRLRAPYPGSHLARAGGDPAACPPTSIGASVRRHSFHRAGRHR